MAIISQPVGDWAKGAKNLYKDVLAIQNLLKKASKLKSKPEYDPELTNGIILPMPAHQQDKTVSAIIAFQSSFLRRPDGLIEPNKTTLKKLNKATKEPEADHLLAWWPPPPNFSPVVSNRARAEIFGKFRFEHTPSADNPEKIRILGDWKRKHIVRVDLPQLAKVTGGKHKHMYFHRLAAKQLAALWADWEKAGLLDRVLTYHGAFVSRYVRGSTRTLSNHAFGSAFDINYRWNKRKRVPAQLGEHGCVRELVPLANAHGFFWGGHYSSTPDGMHFEIARFTG